jgi:hypothetical protein
MTTAVATAVNGPGLEGPRPEGLGLNGREGAQADLEGPVAAAGRRDERDVPPLALVEWHDAWFDFDLPAASDRRADYLVRTVGFVVAQDPRFLSLAQEVLPEGEGFRAVTHIPIAIVERVHPLSPGLASPYTPPA